MDKNFFPSVVVSIVSLISLVRFILTENWEFVFYVFVTVGFFYFVIRSDGFFSYPRVAIWGLVAWVVMHMAGGAVYLRGVRLYDVMLFSLVGEPYNILKYDQVVHFFCYFVIGMLVYFVALKYFGKRDGVKTVLLMFAVLGIGSFYELVEFNTVVMFAHTGVGGYYNLILDLLFNLVGGIVGVLVGRKMAEGRN